MQMLEEDGDEPAQSIINAASEAPTAALPGLRPPPGYQLNVDRAVDVLNAPKPTRKIFQTHPRQCNQVIWKI